MQQAFIFDIDGTLACNHHRYRHIAQEPKNWDAYFAEVHKDIPYWDVIDIAQELKDEYKILYVSGRPESCRQKTQQWLKNFDCPHGPLHMRRDRDHRPDHIVKREIYEWQLRNNYNIIGVFDDRDEVVAMWRSLGLRCYQVQPGDF